MPADESTTVDEGLAPLVVTVQGHAVLVAAFQHLVNQVMPALKLDAVTHSWSTGGADGVVSLEWIFGFPVTEDDLLGGTGAQYRATVYNFPSVDLLGEGVKLLRNRAIRTAVQHRRKQAADVAQGLKPIFGESEHVQLMRAAKEKRGSGRPRGSGKKVSRKSKSQVVVEHLSDKRKPSG